MKNTSQNYLQASTEVFYFKSLLRNTFTFVYKQGTAIMNHPLRLLLKA